MNLYGLCRQHCQSLQWIRWLSLLLVEATYWVGWPTKYLHTQVKVGYKNFLEAIVTRLWIIRLLFYSLSLQ